MLDIEEGSAVEDMHRGAVEEGRHRRTTAGIAVASLAVGVILGTVATLALTPGSSDGVSVGAADAVAETSATSPTSTSQTSPDAVLPPARHRFVATLEAEPGWAPTDHFAGTITVAEAHDGSWHAQVAAQGLQPRHRYGAGVTWDAPFLSGFCIGMSDDAGRWTCTGRINMQHVPPGAKLVSGDLGEASGRVWAHGPIRPA